MPPMLDSKIEFNCSSSEKLESIISILKDIQDNLAEIEDKLNDLESPYAERAEE